MAGTDMYDSAVEKRVNINKVADLLNKKVKLWEDRLNRKLDGTEIMLLNDGIWSGIEFMEHKK